MNWYDRFCLCSNSFSNGNRINTEGLRINFNEYRSKFQQRDHLRGSDIGKGRRDNLIPGIEIKSHHSNLQRICPISTRDQKFCIKIPGKIKCKFLDDLPINERRALNHLLNSQVNLILDLLILGLSIHHLNLSHS